MRSRCYAGYHLPMISYVVLCGAMLALNCFTSRRLRRVITAPKMYKYPVFSEFLVSCSDSNSIAFSPDRAQRSDSDSWVAC